jgi:hypothetical protein
MNQQRVFVTNLVPLNLFSSQFFKEGFGVRKGAVLTWVGDIVFLE